MTHITYYPEAAAAIDCRANELVKALRPLTPEEQRGREDLFHPDTLPRATITENDIIGPIDMERIDVARGCVLVAVETTSGVRALDEPSCRKLDDLLTELLKPTKIRDSVGRAFLRSITKLWLRDSYNGTATETLSERSQNAVAASVAQLTIWIPIHGLHVESPLTLGSVRFQTISPQKLTEWFDHFSSSLPPEETEAFDRRALELRHELQGLAAAVVTLEAEPTHGGLRALELADEATSLLRIFHLAALTPRVCSYCRPLGMEHEEQFQAFVEVSGGVQRTGRVLGPDPAPWRLSDALAAELRASGLQALHELLSVASRSEFQERLLAALLIYSRATTAKQPIEKLVFLLVALESLLLKSETEAIQQNIGERLAFVLGRTPEERRAIVELTSRCYGFRSRFLHHGHDQHELDTLAEFMGYVWAFFARLIRKHDRFSTKSALVQEIERIKYS